MGPEAVK